MAQLPQPLKASNRNKQHKNKGKSNNKSNNKNRNNISHKDNYSDGKKAIYNLGFGDSFYIPNFIKSRKEQKTIFKNLVNEVEFEQMYSFRNKGSEILPIPRLVIAQTYKENTIDTPIYRMPGCNERNISTVEWTPTVSNIREEASKYMKEEFNHCVVTMYRNENDSLGFHKDKLIDLKDNSSILSISFGQPRKIEFRKIDTNKSKNNKYKGTSQLIMLQPGSLLAIGDKTNRNYEHSIIKMNKVDAYDIGPRISLSFRCIDTFKNEESNEIIGKGKEWQTSNYPFTTSYDDVSGYSQDMVTHIDGYKEETNEYLKALRKELNQLQEVDQVIQV